MAFDYKYIFLQVQNYTHYNNKQIDIIYNIMKLSRNDITTFFNNTNDFSSYFNFRITFTRTSRLFSFNLIMRICAWPMFFINYFTKFIDNFFVIIIFILIINYILFNDLFIFSLWLR